MYIRGRLYARDWTANSMDFLNKNNLGDIFLGQSLIVKSGAPLMTFLKGGVLMSTHCNYL